MINVGEERKHDDEMWSKAWAAKRMAASFSVRGKSRVTDMGAGKRRFSFVCVKFGIEHSVAFFHWTIRIVELNHKRKVRAKEGPFGKLM